MNQIVITKPSNSFDANRLDALVYVISSDLSVADFKEHFIINVKDYLETGKTIDIALERVTTILNSLVEDSPEYNLQMEQFQALFTEDVYHKGQSSFFVHNDFKVIMTDFVDNDVFDEQTQIMSLEDWVSLKNNESKSLQPEEMIVNV